MFDRFTENSIKVIMLAQEESRRLGHNYVGTEQILLGTIGEGKGVASLILRSMGANLKDMRIEVEKIIGKGSGFVAVEIPFTVRAKKTFELSWKEACELGFNRIETEHLLLGILDQPDGKALDVLQALNIDLDELRKRLISHSKKADPPRQLMQSLYLAMGLLSALNEGVNSIGPTLTDLHQKMESEEAKPDVLEDEVLQNTLHVLNELLDKFGKSLSQFPTNIHEQIATLKADVQRLLKNKT